MRCVMWRQKKQDMSPSPSRAAKMTLLQAFLFGPYRTLSCPALLLHVFPYIKNVPKMEMDSNGHMTLAVALCLTEAKGVKQRKLASTTHFPTSLPCPFQPPTATKTKQENIKQKFDTSRRMLFFLRG